MKRSTMESRTGFLLAAVGCLALPAGVAAAPQASYYVSPVGSDSNPGTLAAPFRTITKARDVVRTVNHTMSGDIVVTLRAGTYPLDSTITFGPADGGKNGNYVRYVAYNGETPLVTGGKPITGWTIHDPSKNIWKVEGVTSRFRQIYVNNTKAIRARLPNLGANNSANFFRLTKVDTAGKALNIATSVGSSWKNLNKVEMHLMIAWADAVLRLASTTAMGGYTKVKIQPTEENILFNRPYPMLGIAFSSNPPKQQAYYLENALEFLDVAGEWYLDESANTLYYMPRAGEDMTKATVVAPMLEKLVTVAGPNTSNTVGYLAFQGIAFAHSTFMRPSQMGFLDAQAGNYSISSTLQNKQYIGRPSAGVTVINAHHIRLEGNLFSQMAATGLDLVSGTHDNAIVGNVIKDIGGSGITVGKFTVDTATEFHVPYNPADKAEISTRDTIRSNLVTNVTTEIQGAVGIGGGYPRDVVIEHNEVSYMAYSGISVGFGWTKTANAMNNNHINWNHIHHVSQILADGGNIYTLSNQGTSGEIQYNYMHDNSASTWADYWILGIYLDEGSSGMDISHNVSKNSPSTIACNNCGSYTQSDNTGSAASTISGAGIEPAYIGIKTKTLPLAEFNAVAGFVTPAGRNANSTFAAKMRGGRLMFEVPSSEAVRNATLSVYGQDGACVARYAVPGASTGIQSLDFPNAPEGRYFAVLESDKVRYSTPLVKL
ncbi:MAG: carbohydrate-binding protein [Fibrobacteres bacterium]|nr:carbohydrate-binding protein [Fibrobacterota bacterium]